MRSSPSPRARAARLASCALVAGALPAFAAAQTGNAWVTFQKQNNRLVSDATLGLSDVEEKDYAWGDLDQDGWTDLVVVRKEPFTSSGRFPNVLFMNEGGTLVDRTAQFASASDVPGDQGFLTPTNDRDVVLYDVTGDGWLDVITATTLSAGQPKSISHPRVYRNLGKDAGGHWLGLKFENFRIPQLLLSDGTPSFPRFCSVDAGDVTGDGMADLYFGDYDSGGSGGGDMNDRLLVNDGTGVFVDESTMRMTSQMLSSAFGTSVAIHDMNLDGVNDIVKDTALNAPQYVSCSYNNPSNEGFFDLFDDFHHDAPYHVNVGDINNDGRTDVVVSDDGQDRYRYNTGTDTFGRVIWSPAKVFAFVSSTGDDGFGSNNLIRDLDNDGWADILICDVDVDIGGCDRRMHIYHNPGGVPGSQITLIEEAQQTGFGGWKGVVGITAADLGGMHDVAVFDLDNDGDMDMIFGRCVGTDVWINQLDPPPPGTAYCFCDGSGTTPPCNNPGAAGEGCANSTGHGAILSSVGTNSASADNLAFQAQHLLPNQPALLFAGNNAVNGGNGVVFGGGLRCAGANVQRLGIEVPNSLGNATWGPGLRGQGGWNAGDTRRFQVWYRNPGGSCGTGFNLSNGVEVGFVQ